MYPVYGYLVKTGIEVSFSLCVLKRWRDVPKCDVGTFGLFDDQLESGSFFYFLGEVFSVLEQSVHVLFESGQPLQRSRIN